MKRLFVLFNLTFAVVLVLYSSASAQSGQPVKPSTQSAKAKVVVKLTSANPNNQELIDLAQGGASERNLLGAVASAKAEGHSYDKSAKEILMLSNAGVSDAVIEAIRNVGSPTVSSGPATTTVPPIQRVVGSIEPPSTRSVEGREAGIYVDMGKGLVQLEPAVYSGAKSGNKLRAMVPVIGKATLKAVVRSASASQRLHISTPTFMFYFETKGAGLSTASGAFGFLNGATSPNEFILVRLKVSKGERELILAEETHFNDRVGVKPEDTVDFNLEKLSTGVYKVTPKSPLTPGEYCFFPAVSTAGAGGLSGKLFDFGVDVGATLQ